VAGGRLVDAVEEAGDRFALPLGLVGLLAATGADGPEVTAAIISLVKGEHEMSLGVIQRKKEAAQGFPSLIRLILIGTAATAVIIGGCTILVNAALYLGPWLHLPRAWTGTFGLAILTSLPNLWVAIVPARRRQGAVLVSAVCNSTTINLAFGVCLPPLFVVLGPSILVRHLDVPALLVLTLLALGLVWRNRGLGRFGRRV
jgi:Ca2+/Na+ antiporter